MIDEKIESANKYVASRWRLLNRSLDSFFSNDAQQFDEYYKGRDTVKAYLNFYKKEGEDFEKDFDIQLRVDFPKITKKLKLVIEREQDEVANALSDENFPQGRSKSVRRRNSYSAGIDYLISKSRSFQSSFQFGLRLNMPLNPSAKIDLSKEFDGDYATYSFYQKFLYYRQEGFEQITQFTVSKLWSERIQTDLINSLTWTDEDDEFVLRNNIIFYYNLNEEQILSLSFGANALFKPNVHYDIYDISLNHKSPFLYSWLFVTASIGADFEKEFNFRRSYFTQLKTEIYFE